MADRKVKGSVAVAAAVVDVEAAAVARRRRGMRSSIARWSDLPISGDDMPGRPRLCPPVVGWRELIQLISNGFKTHQEGWARPEILPGSRSRTSLSHRRIAAANYKYLTTTVVRCVHSSSS